MLWIVVTLVLVGFATALIAGTLFWFPGSLGAWFASVLAVSLTTPFEAHVLTVLYYRLTEPERPVIAAQRPRRWKTIWEEEREAVLD